MSRSYRVWGVVVSMVVGSIGSSLLAAEAPAPATSPATNPVAAIIKPMIRAKPKAAPVDPTAVDKAIKDRIDYIYAQQNPDGTWGPPPANEWDRNIGGYTALATYALLAAHEKETDARLIKAITYLKGVKMNGVYQVALRCSVWNLLKPTEEIRGMIRIDAEWLLKAYNPDKTSLGYGKFDYDENHQDFDHSVSQYGVLGLWACSQQHLEVPEEFWKAADTGWRKWQNTDGGWCYARHGWVDPAKPVVPYGPNQCGPSVATLTAAGVATLFITEDQLYADRGVKCAGDQHDETMKAIDRGLEWMGQHLDGIGEGYGYYGVERIGVASGYKYFGGQDWFQVCAAKLLKTEIGYGAWGNIASPPLELLFLVRGRAPVLFNKLNYDLYANGDKLKLANWDERPRDCANLCRYALKVTEHDFNWQIVTLKADVEDLHDSPILYLTGNQDLMLSPEDEQKLRTFVEQGGLILGNADCATPEFANGFQKMGQRLFPSYKFRKLPADHFIFNNSFPAKGWKSTPEVQGLTNGTRELMLLIPKADVSRYWQTGSIAGKEEFHQLMVNILAYSVQAIGDPPSGHLRPKGVTYMIDADAVVTAASTMKVARLHIGDNWNPEPGGWQRLANFMHNQDKVDLSVEEVKVGEKKLDAAVYKVAHLTGTSKVDFTAAQTAELSKYIAAGGTLIVDSAGNNPLGTAGDFKTSMEAILPTLVPNGRLKQLASDHPILMENGNPMKLEFNPYARKVIGTGGLARIKSVEFQDRSAIIYSPEDISTGMVGMWIEGIGGYSPDSASKLMEHMLLYAANPKAGVAAGATAGATSRPATAPAN